MTDGRRTALLPFAHTAMRLVVCLGLAFATASAAGCFRVGRLPSLEYYVLAIPRPSDDDTPLLRTAVLAGPIAIVPFDAPGIYGDDGIVFRIDDNQLHAYPSRMWAQPLGDMLGMATETVLATRPLTVQPAIFDPPSRGSYAYVWQGRVREFEEVDRGDQVFAAVALDVRIVRSPGDSVIWSRSRRLERPVPDPTMQGIVRVLSELTVDVLTELADSARAALTVPTASSARPPN